MSTTESPSHYSHLEKMSVQELLVNINKEDQTVPHAIEKVIPKIELLVNAIVEKMAQGGRLFYIGSGTSGRLGVVDASEIPPTYGMPHVLFPGEIKLFACQWNTQKMILTRRGLIYQNIRYHQRMC